MNHIVSLHIEGFRKFYSLDVRFNEHMNILVGENEAGKSTILDAIKTVMNQQYRTVDKSIIKDLLNAKMVEEFKAAPSVKALPHIKIELVLMLDSAQKSNEYFHGEVYGSNKSKALKYGISFECKYDEELGAGLEASIAAGKIPYEYYALTWKTFGGRPYQSIKRPLRFISIDTTCNSSAPSFNYYNRSLFESKFGYTKRVEVKNNFREKLDGILSEIALPDIDDKRRFGVDGKKVILESILSVYEDAVALENKGSGMESLIKTQIALERANGLNVILIEEPENHLCFSNLKKMLKEISDQQTTSQIIVTTHNNMIASGLNLNNVLWIGNDGEIKYLSGVDKPIAEFFEKADDNSFLQLLLSKKVILVEGATEFLLLPLFYKKITGHEIENDGITIISCNGISYKKYLAIAGATNKKIAVITDNDENAERITAANSFNEENSGQHVFMGGDVENWTWEACLYNANKALFDEKITVEDGALYLFHKRDYGRVLGKMLNNKVDTAYWMLTSGIDFEIPQYVKDAIKWIKE